MAQDSKGEGLWHILERRKQGMVEEAGEGKSVQGLAGSPKASNFILKGIRSHRKDLVWFHFILFHLHFGDITGHILKVLQELPLWKILYQRH